MAGARCCLVIAALSITNNRFCNAKQFAYPGQVFHLHAAREQAVVADAMQALGQRVDQEASDELVWVERHRRVAGRPIAPIVLDAEGDATGIGLDQASVRDRNAVCIARQVGEHGLRSSEGRPKVDMPLDAPDRPQEPLEGFGVGEMNMRSKEVELAGVVGGHELFEHQPAEQF